MILPRFLNTAALLLLAGLTQAQQADPLAAARRSIGLVGTNPIHCRVTFQDHPATEAILSWSTARPGRHHRVYYDTVSRLGDLESYALQRDSTRNGRFTNGAGAIKNLEIHYHHVQLRQLEPATTYYCVMASDGQASREFHFRTGPDDDRKIKLIFGGDSRSGLADRQRVNRLLSQTLTRYPDIVAMVHGGDYVAVGNNLVQWATWLTHQQMTMTDAGRLLPIIPVRGNHEGIHPQFNEVFHWPGGEKKNYYTTTIGSLTSLVILNTETVAAGDQRKYLARTLDQQQGLPWQMAAYHRPAYPAVKQPSHARQHWVPLFDQFQLDLVLEADGHVIKRTLPIRHNAHHPDGVVYIGEGGLGVKQRDPDPGRWFVQHPGMTSKGHHVHLLTITPTALRTEVLLVPDGQIVDTWLKQPRRRN